MKILSVDLGKFKRVFCVYQNDREEFRSVPTERAALADAIRRATPDLVMFETCTTAGWVADLC